MAAEMVESILVGSTGDSELRDEIRAMSRLNLFVKQYLPTRIPLTNMRVMSSFGSAVGHTELEPELQRREPENLSVALRDMPLSADAAETMERMLNDPTTPTHEGVALPTLSVEELMRRLGR